RDVKDFDATQKSNVFSSLYTVAPSSWTPLRGALSKAGRYYANKAPGQTYDPVQYSCQRNYALLSTDGYWNTNDESSTYGPYVVDSNTSVGEQDASEARPMKDGSSVITTTVTTYTAPGTADYTSTNQSSTLTWTRPITTTVSVSKKTCSSRLYRATFDQYAYETRYRYFTTPKQGTLAYTSTMTSVDGGTPTGPVDTTPAPQGSWVTAAGASTSTVIFGDTGTPSSSAYTTDYSAQIGAGKCVSSVGSDVIGTASSASSWSSWSGSLIYSYTNVVATSGYTASAPVTNTTYSGGSSDSLADVAEYYWKTDLRNSSLGNCTSSSSGTSEDVCTDIVRTTSDDPNTAQHMNTFTMGFGTNGTLLYDKNYPTQTSGDYVDLKNGVKNWTNPYDGGAAENIDDLWHAAVNGRGRYYSITNATDLSDAIAGVVASIDSKAGAAAAAATSTLELVSGDNNQLFSASYTTYQWTGDLKAYSIDGHANISTTADWSAQTKLDATTYTSRNIYFNGTSGLTAFNYSNLSATQKAYFDNLCTKSIVAAQCTTLSTSDKTLANSGTNLVNYLRGDRTYENSTTSGSTTVAALYRARAHVLGDIINGAPVYVGKPPFSYADANYADFVSTNRSRKPMVYVAANDGMLHAISADTTDAGNEMWAFIPSAVMPNMYALADTNYGVKHQYFVDGAPVMGDVKIGGAWKTILVGGLNKGGSSYYALDITNPTAPVMLWEFTDPNLGLTYGNPIITKNQAGNWVVVITSGLNNTSGDGKGHLFVLDAGTGTKLVDINTGAGSTTTPSGLAKINAWVDSTTDNTAKHFYGGDMLGNVWRFDPDARYGSSANAVQLAKLQLDSVTPQPITTKPVTALISGSDVVIVGTGRYLGESDITDTTTQSIYAIRDPLGTTGWGDVRSDTTDFTQQTITLNSSTASAATSASITSNSVDWTKGGWWVDLPQAGERVAINMGLQLGTLAVGTAIPNGDACSSGGSSWRYYFNLTTGSAIPGADIGARWSTNTLIVGISWVKDADGNVRTIFQDSDGKLRTEVPPTVAGGGSGVAHRTSWRELVD
ncbi:MAG TPA: PilC/PilY family type IV pilus protein, partial [Aquabacterium sp.]|nr:PilC/PilY family type IV pilus protein [Aquabacterium sp.]